MVAYIIAVAIMVVFCHVKFVAVTLVENSFVAVEGFNYSAMCNPNMMSTDDNSAGTDFSWSVPYYTPKNTTVLEHYNNRELVLLNPTFRNSGVYTCTASKDGLKTTYEQSILFSKLLSNNIFQEINITILSTSGCFGQGRVNMKLYSAAIKQLFCDAKTTPDTCHFTFSDMRCVLERGYRASDFYGAAKLLITIYPRISSKSFQFSRCRDWDCLFDHMYTSMNEYYQGIQEKLNNFNTDLAEYPFLYKTIKAQLPDSMSFTQHAQQQTCGLGYEKGDREFLCVPCSPGTFGSSGFICLKCKEGQYQDEYASGRCKNCLKGEITPGQDGCENKSSENVAIAASNRPRRLLKRSSITYIYPKSKDYTKWVLVGIIVACGLLALLPIFICCDMKHKRETKRKKGAKYYYCLSDETIMSTNTSNGQ